MILDCKRTAVAVLTALSVVLGSLALSPGSAAASDFSKWFDDSSQFVDDYGKWAGGYMKDWTEGKAGYGSSWKLSDTKKYGLITATASLMGLIGLNLADPATEFRNQMLIELDGLVTRLTDMVNQVVDMLDTVDDIIDALDEGELKRSFDLIDPDAQRIMIEFNGPGNEYYQRYATQLKAYHDALENDPDYDDPDLHDDLEAYYLRLGGSVSGPYQSLQNGVLSFLPTYTDIITSRFGTDPGSELAYYDAVLVPIRYYDSVSAAAALMLVDYYSFLAFQDPPNEAFWVSEADRIVDVHLDFRRQMYEMVGFPAGNDDYVVSREGSTWVMHGSDDDPRREWYDMQPGDTEVDLTGFPMTVAGRPTINSAVWHLSTTFPGEQDRDDDGALTIDAPTIEVYEDGNLVQTIEQQGFVFPGPDADEVTLAASRDDAEAADGWAIVAVPSEDVAEFARWSGDSDAAETTTVTTGELGWSFFTAVFQEPWSRVDITVQGGGAIEVWEDGHYVTAMTPQATAAEPLSMLGGQESMQLHLTTDPEVAANPDTSMALLATGGTVAEWSPGSGATDTVFTVDPGQTIEVDAIIDEDEPVDTVTLDLTIDGPGTVATYLDGEHDHTITESGPVYVGAGDVTFTADSAEIPGDGWAVVADARGHRFDGWSGAVNGTDTQTVSFGADTTHQLGAAFAEKTTRVEVLAGNGGNIEVYDADGAYVDTLTSGSRTFELTGDELTLTTDRNDLPADGAALLAVPETNALFRWWSGAGSGAETQTLALSPDTTIWVASEFVITTELPTTVDRAGSRVGGVTPHVANGAVVVRFADDLAIVEGVDSPVSLSYEQPGMNYPYLPEYRDLRVNDLVLELDDDGTVHAEVSGWARHWNVMTMGSERRNNLTDATAEFDAVTGTLVVHLYSIWGHEGTVRLVGEPPAATQAGAPAAPTAEADTFLTEQN